MRRIYQILDSNKIHAMLQIIFPSQADNAYACYNKVLVLHHNTGWENRNSTMGISFLFLALCCFDIEQRGLIICILDNIQNIQNMISAQRL